MNNRALGKVHKQFRRESSFHQPLFQEITRNGSHRISYSTHFVEFEKDHKYVLSCYLIMQ